MDTCFITNVRFEKGLHMKKLESEAFRNCLIREVLDVPASVEVIGWGCFEEAQLERITFEEGSRLRVLEDSCFRDCPLKSIELPDTVEEIEDCVFTEDLEIRFSGKLKKLGEANTEVLKEFLENEG